MDNAQKAIMIGVGLFITIIIISAVLLIVNLGTGLVDDATAELGTMSTSLQNQILQSYDNKILSGVQVRSAIQQYMRATDMTVVLIGQSTSNGNTTVKIAATVGAKKLGEVTPTGEAFKVSTSQYSKPTGDATTHKTSMNEFNDITKAGSGVYINTSSNYRSYVLEVDGTDTIVGVVFVPNDVSISSNNSISVPSTSDSTSTSND